MWVIIWGPALDLRDAGPLLGDPLPDEPPPRFSPGGRDNWWLADVGGLGIM